MRTSILKVSVLSALLCASGAALAGPSPQTGSFAVTATVNASCRVTGTTNVAFSSTVAYDPADVHFAAPLDAAGNVTVRCTKGTTAAVALDQGLNPAGGSTCVNPLRRMSDGGAERLSYGLYTDAARTTAWGCDATNDQSFTAVGSNSPTTLQVFGRIPAAQDVAPGSYTDTVTVTVTF